MKTRPSRRGLLHFPSLSSLGDTLLHKSDLPPKDPDYLRVMDQEHFRKKFGVVKRIFIYDTIPKLDKNKRRIPRRYAAVLPLEVKELGVIPIPFIMDTGAPGALYLGSKPLDILRQLNILREVITHEYPYLLKDAALCHGDTRLEPVLACSVPHTHESEEGGTLGDICCNILGAEALWHFPDLLHFKTKSE